MNEHNENEIEQQKYEGMGKCIATTIIYPSLILLIAFFMFSAGGISLIGLLGALACCVGAGICTYISGLYLIIIPLPIIYLMKYGCVKYRPWYINLLFGAAIIILYVLAFVFMFAIPAV